VCVRARARLRLLSSKTFNRATCVCGHERRSSARKTRELEQRPKSERSAPPGRVRTCPFTGRPETNVVVGILRRSSIWKKSRCVKIVSNRRHARTSLVRLTYCLNGFDRISTGHLSVSPSRRLIDKTEKQWFHRCPRRLTVDRINTIAFGSTALQLIIREEKTKVEIFLISRTKNCVT